MMYAALLAVLFLYLLGQTSLLQILVIFFNILVDKLITPFIKPAILVSLFLLAWKYAHDGSIKFSYKWVPCSGVECLISAWKAGVEEYKKCSCAARKKKLAKQCPKKCEVTTVSTCSETQSSQCSSSDAPSSTSCESSDSSSECCSEDDGIQVINFGTTGATVTQLNLANVLKQ